MFKYNHIIMSNSYNGFINKESGIADNCDFQQFKLTDNERLQNPIFKSIGYPSKIYYENIRKFIKEYTKKGAYRL